MFNIDLAIKFGSNEIIIYRKGVGIIAKEPAYLAVVETNGKTKVKAIGKRAEKMFYSKTDQVNVYQPIVNSEIVNEKMAVVLIGEILSNIIQDKFMLSNLSALVAVPCALGHDQLLLIKRVLHESGVNKVEFVQNSVCVQTSLDLDPQAHIMVVDIGKYITDISVLNEFNFSFGRMYYIGGQDMDKSIATFVLDNHNLHVSELTCENIKNEIASLYDRDSNNVEYAGINDANKFENRYITASEVKVAIVNVYDAILKFVGEVFKDIPADISKEVYNTGVVFVGGASSIAGLYEYAKKKLDMKIIVPEDPTDCVILGAGKLLSHNKEFLKIEI
ncbi:MAG: rod shape-determining protein [Clostridia bacterium]|nr:rod shape-determining protein [Clostridia bacterium]